MNLGVPAPPGLAEDEDRVARRLRVSNERLAEQPQPAYGFAAAAA